MATKRTRKAPQTAKAPLPAPPPTKAVTKKQAAAKAAAKAAPGARKAAIKRKADPERAGRLQNGFGLPATHLERALLTGESQGLLEDYFGPEGYQQLRDLSRDASSRGVRGGPRVYVLPGIMGSTLARSGALGLQNTLWLDPVEIALGHLSELKLTGTTSPYHASGVILFSYLKLKLRLKLAGYDADFFPYDWRMSLTTAGGFLAGAIRQDPAAEVNLVAHSMGGLVARAALTTLGAAGKKVGKVIMLGTPNYGSFAPVQVMRGTYEVVNTIAKVDFKHTAEDLAGDVFSTFPGLYEMMPAPGKFDGLNLYDTANWPKTGPSPRAQNLSAVKPVIDRLAGADDRFYLIAGVNQPTVTSLHVDPDKGEFVFDVSADGDGTVPLAFARLAGIADSRTYYVEESHGSLPNHGGVESAVVDLLSSGATQALPKERPATNRAIRSVSETDLREAAKQRAAEAGPPGSSDFRHLLDAVAAPPKPAVPVTALAAAAAVAGGAPVDRSSAPVTFQNLVIGRRSQRRLELRLAKGSITDVDSQAYVLGIFRGVAPSGAAKAIDQRLDGAITEFTARRIFSGDVGELFTIPAGRSRLGADQVVFAGLGAFDSFNSDVQQLVGENTVRVLVRSRVDEFATVLIGAGSGRSIPAVLEDMLGGFLRGLRDADPHQRFRGITICETDPARYAEMKAALFNMAGTALFDEVELTLDEIELPPPSSAPAPALAAGEEPVYVMIRQEAQAGGRAQFRVSILGSGMKAAVVSAAQNILVKDLEAQLDKFDKAVDTASSADIRNLGKEFATMVLPLEVCTVLSTMRDRHLVIVHDASSSRIPWETLTVDDWSASLTGGLSRRYLADDLPITTWLEQRRSDPTLKLLLIVNPLSDLDGAEKEGDRIVKLASGIDALEVTQLRGPQCTKPAVLAALRSGKYDIVHYAGHAFFDPKNPGRSGLFCTGRNVLTGADLLGLSNLPFLVFFNACESSRVRGKPAPKPIAATTHAAGSFGVAETLMRGGVANYMGTYWPVGDDAANTFASTFYQSLMAGNSIGAALLEGRKAVDKLAVRDWADYILYGSFDFILKPKKSE